MKGRDLKEVYVKHGEYRCQRVMWLLGYCKFESLDEIDRRGGIDRCFLYFQLLRGIGNCDVFSKTSSIYP